MLFSQSQGKYPILAALKESTWVTTHFPAEKSQCPAVIICRGQCPLPFSLQGSMSGQPITRFPADIFILKTGALYRWPEFVQKHSIKTSLC